jgi:Na+/phosphate symporter
LEDIAGWVAPAATMIAAVMTAANLGARVTGWGFVVFVIGSISWSIVGISSGQSNLLWTNGFLTLVNAMGVWR